MVAAQTGPVAVGVVTGGQILIHFEGRASRIFRDKLDLGCERKKGQG